MRRPNLCSNSVAVADDAYKPSNANPEKEEGRLSLVRRMLGGSRKKDGNSSAPLTKQFGVPLSELPLANNGTPKVLQRMCSYIESFGMCVEGLFYVSGGNPSLADSLKTQFNLEGDANLEGVADVSTVALLLKMWLKDLPQPPLNHSTANELITLMHKYDGDSWWGRVAHDCISSCGILSVCVLETILRLLHDYLAKHPTASSYIPNVFSSLIAPLAIPNMTHLTAKLIKDYKLIFNKRSNSEERPGVKPAFDDAHADTMRRVSSHEDFSNTQSVKSVDSINQVKKMAQPLQERNSCSPQRSMELSVHHGVESNSLTSPVGYESELYDENEHERRRNSERFAPQRHRNPARRRRPKQLHSTHKENEVVADQVGRGKGTTLPRLDQVHPPKEGGLASEEGTESIICPQVKEEKGREEECPPSPISTLHSSPTRDLNTLKDEISSPAEPLTCTPWSSLNPSEERLVSPRNSLVVTRRIYTGIGQGEEESTVLDLTAQINSIKKKLKKYEEGFEKEFGFRPSHSDKLANKDIKKMSISLNKLRKQLKALREEAATSDRVKSSKHTLTEDVVRGIEKKLAGERASSERKEKLDMLSQEELVEEKVAMQKALLQLEATYGRPTTKEERDIVRPLYDRYRIIKKMIIRFAPSKMKDSMSELGTILEHEAMDFSTSPPPTPPRAFSPPTATAPRSPPSPSPPPPSDLVFDNLHSLPLEELLELHRVTREEKKKLRKCLKESEMEFQIKMGRRPQKEERSACDPTYVDYKHAKAKLRFLDALLNKLK